MSYRCEKAYKRAGDDTLRCDQMQYPNDCCAHVKFCRITGHWENGETYADCPLRKSKNLKGEKNDGKQV